MVVSPLSRFYGLFPVGGMDAVVEGGGAGEAGGGRSGAAASQWKRGSGGEAAAHHVARLEDPRAGVDGSREREREAGRRLTGQAGKETRRDGDARAADSMKQGQGV